MKENKAINTWLITVLALIGIIVLVGGITRLTGSGLSMVNWKPLMGFIPPLNHADWVATFTLYKQFPEYIYINSQITLDQFKWLYFWEYLHRNIGRIIGLALIGPYVYFLIKKTLSPRLIKRGAIMSILLIAQGLMGWFMVKSGLVQNPHVSHFRLAAHLTLAFILFQYILWTLFDINTKNTEAPKLSKRIQWSAITITGLVSIQIILGAFTAGLDAGYIYNTFPKMGENWYPIEHLSTPILSSKAFSTPALVQWMHRSLAWVIVIAIAALQLLTLNKAKTQRERQAILGLSTATFLQFCLGIMTLVTHVHIHTALTHQMAALLLLSCAVRLNHTLKSTQ